MNKVRILIVEDELIIAEDMKDILKDLGYSVVGITGQEDEAKRMLIATEPDLAILDITLGKNQSGLEIADFINQNVFIPFVFCTSYADKNTVTKAKDLHPNGYLIKPFNKDDLYSAIEVALSNFSLKPESEDKGYQDVKNLIMKDSLFIKEGSVYQKVTFPEIMWVSPEGNYSIIHLKGDSKFVVRMPLKDFHAQLPKDRFFRTHRSYIVNVEQISAINSNNVFVDGNEIPLGKSFRDVLLSQLRKLQ
ncbi:LytR/AlgR family response regulator transcription factor [Ekhidna sp.]